MEASPRQNLLPVLVFLTFHHAFTYYPLIFLALDLNLPSACFDSSVNPQAMEKLNDAKRFVALLSRPNDKETTPRLKMKRTEVAVKDAERLLADAKVKDARIQEQGNHDFEAIDQQRQVGHTVRLLPFAKLIVNTRTSHFNSPTALCACRLMMSK